MGLLNDASKFLGVKKFGEAIATTGRVLSGGVARDIQRTNENISAQNKAYYAYKQEQNPEKKKQLLNILQGYSSVETPLQINKGLNYSNREIVGSALNTGLNLAGGAAFKGGKAALLAKNAALGASYGFAGGLESGRNNVGLVGSTLGGGIIGGAFGTAGILAKSSRDFFTKTTPKWLMNKAIKPSLDESRKALKFKNPTLGDELLGTDIKGSPEKILNIADTNLTKYEDELQGVISKADEAWMKNNPGTKPVKREQIAPYLKDLFENYKTLPGMKGEAQKIKAIYRDLPKEMTYGQALKLKRQIYSELRDVAYKLDPNLSVKAKALKGIARGLKQATEKADPTVKDINQQLSLYGRVEDRIVDEMARTMRRNGFTLTDSILTAGGIGSMSPAGMLSAMSLAGARKGLGSTRFRTNTAQTLNRMQGFGSGPNAINKSFRYSPSSFGQGARKTTRMGVLNAPGGEKTNQSSDQSTQPLQIRVQKREPLQQDTTTVSKVNIPKTSRLAYVNNNPGNLRFAGQAGAVKGEKGFARFSTPEAGFKALKNQIALDAKRGLNLAQFVAKYAPPSENNTTQYIQQVIKATGASAKTPLKQVPLDQLAMVIAKKESSTSFG